MPNAEVTVLTPDFIVINYDIPAKMKAERHAFIRDAKALGAVERSGSSYYMPWSVAALALANQLAEIPGATVDVYVSHVPDKAKAATMMDNFADKVKERCDFIETRLALAQEQIDKGNLGAANRTFQRTYKLISQLAKINDYYHSDWLKGRLVELAQKLQKVYGEADS